MNLRRSLQNVPLIVFLIGAANAQRGQPPTTTPLVPQKDRAEAVFANAASKIVFLITRQSGELHASASGVILSADGYIGTNYHALQGADAVEIRFFADPANSEDYQSFGIAKLLYANSERDIAILKVNSNTLPFFACPKTTGCEARIGESVYAIGNPKGLSNTISQGIVSALRAEGGEDIVQHTAPISPGSSGGALVDSNGNLLGMNSWQVADAQNLNFAISAKHLLEALGAARLATTALRFPPEAPAEATSATEDKTGQAAAGQDFAAKDKAVSQMRRIVDALRQCPESTGSFDVAIVHNQSPRILEWDVLPSTSLRAPFQGYVWFDLPQDLQETDEAKRSKELHAKYEFLVTTLSKFLEYRYEFDLGSDAPELKRALIKFPAPLTGPPIFKPYEPSPNSQGTIFCWDRIARSPEPAAAPENPAPR
jgi:Trypsin-like peptidase domain